MPRVKHAVLMKFKPSTPAQKVSEMMAALAALRGQIAGLLDYSGGAAASNEGFDRGFTHGFVMTFADVASRDAYLPHPEHEKVKQLVLPELDGGLDGVIVFDWLEPDASP